VPEAQPPQTITGNALGNFLVGGDNADVIHDMVGNDQINGDRRLSDPKVACSERFARRWSTKRREVERKVAGFNSIRDALHTMSSISQGNIWY
jgi:hypothetical protein